MKDLLLAIDNGTQSVRALVFDLQGNLLAKARVSLDACASRRSRGGPNRTRTTTGGRFAPRARRCGATPAT